MKRTKAKYTYKCVLHFLTLCTVSILFVSLCAAHSGFFQANAAVLSVHNYVTDDTFNYEYIKNTGLDKDIEEVKLARTLRNVLDKNK